MTDIGAHFTHWIQALADIIEADNSIAPVRTEEAAKRAENTTLRILYCVLWSEQRSETGNCGGPGAVVKSA